MLGLTLQGSEVRKGFFKEVVFMLKPKELKSSKSKRAPAFLPRKSVDRGARQATVHRVPRVRNNLVTKS